MTKNEYETVMIVTEMIALTQFTNEEVAALNLAIALYGKVDTENLSYRKAVDYKLIREDGSPFDKDTILNALASVSRDRIDNGNWQ